MKIELFDEIIESKVGTEIVWGENDCNLLFLELYEPHLRKLFNKKFYSKLEAIRFAKDSTGYSTVSKFLKDNSKYTQLQNSDNLSKGDILVDSINVVINCGRVFLAEYDGKFHAIPIRFLDKSKYKIYRRK